MNFFSPFDSEKESKLFLLCKCLQIITQNDNYTWTSCSCISTLSGLPNYYFRSNFAVTRNFVAAATQVQRGIAHCLRLLPRTATNKNFAQKCRISKKIYVKVFFCRKPQSIYSLLCGLCPISQQIYILRIMQCSGVLDKFRLKMSGLYSLL